MSGRKEKASKLRQQLKQNESRRDQCIEQLVSERGPLMRGTYLVQARRCGKQYCRCSRGELHPITVLTASEKGRTKNIYVKSADRERVKRSSYKYQCFRRARAELAKLAHASLEIIDQLQTLITVPYPPAAKKATRKAKQRGQNKRKKR